MTVGRPVRGVVCARQTAMAVPAKTVLRWARRRARVLLPLVDTVAAAPRRAHARCDFRGHRGHRLRTRELRLGRRPADPISRAQATDQADRLVGADRRDRGPRAVVPVPRSLLAERRSRPHGNAAVERVEVDTDPGPRRRGRRARAADRAARPRVRARRDPPHRPHLPASRVSVDRRDRPDHGARRRPDPGLHPRPRARRAQLRVFGHQQRYGARRLSTDATRAKR